MNVALLLYVRPTQYVTFIRATYLCLLWSTIAHALVFLLTNLIINTLLDTYWNHKPQKITLSLSKQQYKLKFTKR